MLPLKRKMKAEGGPPVFVFKLNSASNIESLHKRAKYEPERRHEVNSVRHNRACLRCALLKLPCSKDDICITCSDLILDTHRRKTLSFSGCVRTRLSEVSIFEDLLPRQELRKSVFDHAKVLQQADISLQFKSQVNWKLDTLVEDIVHWLHGYEHTETSKVGTLSSPNFSALVSSSMKEVERKNFQTMLYAVSLAFTQPIAKHKYPLDVLELRQLGAINGHEMLKYLEKRLKPQSLKSASFTDIQVLFLVVFGTILATTYTIPPPKESSILEKEEKIESTSKYSHLCQILAHYLVYLGSCLKLSLENDMEQHLLETVPSRWNKSGNFEWGTDGEECDHWDIEIPAICGFEFDESGLQDWDFPMNQPSLFPDDSNSFPSPSFVPDEYQIPSGDGKSPSNKVVEPPAPSITSNIEHNKTEYYRFEVNSISKLGRRKSALNSTTRLKAKEMRSAGACLRCGLSKTTCQPYQPVCASCSNSHIGTPPQTYSPRGPPHYERWNGENRMDLPDVPELAQALDTCEPPNSYRFPRSMYLLV